VRNVFSYLNPDKLDAVSMVCDIGYCNSTCFCRGDLMKSLLGVLFPDETTVKVPTVNVTESDSEFESIKLDL